ncbi:PleD family two-component system response regulator [Methyloligella sp. 2.7D]|uniref:PleD family two-component system response regulator n=1 Tax=unclassified Methyloligella TaxID=2625955 RepID=UPI00157C2460|nr:PleD family two-component system response regulator [Methyloligella sp. GL2]QKP77420.1 PleD family two-component system response regulator [Methyloligella sp. GL2]
MTARILVVDDVDTNVRLLEARLTADYFDVRAATSGPEALQICARERIDVILLDVMMPGMDGFEVCRRLKAEPRSQHIPVIMVTALDQPSDKLKGLEAGADDFLTKPVDDIALITRVKNLARLKTLTDEMLMRVSTEQQMGLGALADSELQDLASGGKILLVEDRPSAAERIVGALTPDYEVALEPDPSRALLDLPEGEFDLMIVSTSLENADGLRLCSQVRSLDRTRHLPILIIVEEGEDARLMRGLDIGVNDYITRPIDPAELLARVRTQVKRKRYIAVLRMRLEESVEMAVLDPLTSLHNRRYMTSHLGTLFEEAAHSGRPLSVLLVDIDFFKAVNDSHGHDAGDLVLKEFASRIRRGIRGIDLACRLGGEEFVVVMPDTDLARAFQVAERLRDGIASSPFYVGTEADALDITASVGVASFEFPDDTPEIILKRADQALYCAKRDGRNKVVADAA